MQGNFVHMTNDTNHYATPPTMARASVTGGHMESKIEFKLVKNEIIWK